MACMPASCRYLTVVGLDMFIGNAAGEKLKQRGVNLFAGSTTSEDAIRSAMQGVDYVIHCAALMDDALPWEEIMKVNVEGTALVARIAKESGVKVFIHLSSVMVYGFVYPPNIAEDGPLNGSNNAYCVSKIEGEKALLHLQEKGVFNVIIVRPGDVYGPRCVPWVSTPIRRMKAGQLRVAGDGLGIMNHIYVDNLLDALFLLMLEKVEEASGQIYNVTDGVATTWKEYFGRLADAAGLSPPPHMPADELRALLSLPTDDSRRTDLDPGQPSVAVDYTSRPYAYNTDKIRALGFVPKVGIAEGFERIAAWLKSEQ